MTISTSLEDDAELKKTAEIMAGLEAENLQTKKSPGRFSFAKKYRQAFKALLADPAAIFGILSQKTSPNTINVAVVVDGGFGDFLRINAVLDAFSKRYPGSSFDIFTRNKKRAQTAFESLSGIGSITHVYMLHWVEGRYDVIYQSHWGMVDAKFGPGAPPELIRNHQKDRHLFALAEEFEGGSASNTMGRKAVDLGYDYMDLLCLSAGLGIVRPLKPVLELTGVNNVLSGQRYITVHHGWDTSNADQVTPVKCWPLKHWEQFLKLFKQRFPEIKVVQLGAQTATNIAGVDINLINKTTFKQACAVIADSLLHVDADGGFTHISRIFGTKAIVMFGPTNCEFIGYRENINIKSVICGNCANVNRHWEHPCPRGFSEPICMDSITPEFVMKHAAAYIASRLAVDVAMKPATVASPVKQVVDLGKPLS